MEKVKYELLMLKTDTDERCKKLFLCYDMAVQWFGRVELSDYEVVSTGTLDLMDPRNAAEMLYTTYNCYPPESYHGRSMIVSDVLHLIDAAGNEQYLYCDSVGFVELEV